jgi:hypothetical protein
VGPKPPGQHPGKGGEYGAVSPAWPRARDLPPQDRDLVPKHEDLRVLGGIAARQPAEHLDHEQVDEANEHERRA